MVDTKPAQKSCFVIGQIGDPDTEIRQKADDFLKYVVRQCPAIEPYRVVRADDIGQPGRITTQIMRAIVEADLIIADVTGENPNVYYEMALCHGLGKPTIVCAEQGTRLPFDTRDNRTIMYHLHSRLAEKARQELGAQITAINREGFKPDNPIAESNAVFELKSAGKADQAGVLEVLEKIMSRLSAIENRQNPETYEPTSFNIGKAGRKRLFDPVPSPPLSAALEALSEAAAGDNQKR
jgi:hypothetical protein